MTIHHEPDPSSGAPGVTLRLADAFRSYGHEVSVLSFADLPATWPAVAKMVAFPLMVASHVTVAQLRHPVDVVDASTGDAALFAYLRRALPRAIRPLLVTRSHGLEHTAHETLRREARARGATLSWKYPLYHGGLKLWQVGVSLRQADLVFMLNTKDAAYAATQLRVRPQRIRVVSNGVSADLLADHPGKRLAVELPDHNPVQLAHLGRFSAAKGIPLLSRELTAVMRADRRVHAGFYGTGVTHDVVRASFPPDVNDRVTSVPAYVNSELRSLLRSHQIVVSASTSEGFNIGVVEGMACGLAPVVASTAVADGIVTQGESGIVVDSSAEGAFRHAVESLTRNPALLAEVRRAAAVRASDFAWPAIAEQQLSLYAQATVRWQEISRV